jgi:hypothetical protein
VDEEAAKVERDSCRVRRGEMLWTRGTGLFKNTFLFAERHILSSLDNGYKYFLRGKTQEGKTESVLLYKSSAELWEASFAGGEDVDGFGRGLTIAEMDEEDMFEHRAEVLVEVVRCEADARGIRLVERAASSANPSTTTPAQAPTAAANRQPEPAATGQTPEFTFAFPGDGTPRQSTRFAENGRPACAYADCPKQSQGRPFNFMCKRHFLTVTGGKMIVPPTTTTTATTSSTGASVGTPYHRTASAAPAAVTPDDSARETGATDPSDGANDIANAANKLVAAVNDQQTKLTEIKAELAETKAKLAEANEALAKTKEENAKLTQENENLRADIQKIGDIANKITDSVNV